MVTGDGRHQVSDDRDERTTMSEESAAGSPRPDPHPPYPGWVTALRQVRRGVDAVAGTGGTIARYAVLAAFAVGIVNVGLRYVGRATGQTLVSNLYVDLQWQLFAVTVLAGLAYGMREGVNPRVDIFTSRWPVRRRAALDLAVHVLLFVPFCVVAVAVTWPFAMTALGRAFDGSWATWQVWLIWEQSANPGGAPLGPVKLLLWLGFVGLLAQALAQVVGYVLVLSGRPELGPHATSDDLAKAA
jgi:TRAP-type mannitol/chloroaromatic compound transport system permease small subunit